MNAFKFATKEIARAVRWVFKAASTDVSRPILNGIEIENDQTVCADGFRIHLISTPEEFKEFEGKTIKPLQNLTVTPRLTEFEEIDGSYPDWEAIRNDVLEKESVFRIAVNKNLLADLKDMPTSENDMIVLSFTATGAPIHVFSFDNEAEAIIMPMLPDGLDEKINDRFS